MNILALLRSRFAQALAPLTDDAATFVAMVRPAQDPRFGDFQANCAMPLAKQLGRPPREVAAQIVEHLSVSDLCEPPQIAGPGFINLRLRDDWLEETVNHQAVDPRLGVPSTEQPRTYVVDYSSPNVAKPMHVGHLRSTVIGDALKRLLAFVGHRALGDNHLGDWGTQFGMIIFGYKHFRDEEAFARDPVTELARLYRTVNALISYQEATATLPDLEAQLALREQELQQATAEEKPDKQRLKKLRAAVEQARERLREARDKCTAVETDPHLRALSSRYPDIAQRAREETARLHAGDPENRALWERFLPECLKALDAVYRRLGIEFDMTLGESFYQPMLAGVVEDLLRKGIARESHGAICVFIEGHAAPFIIRKSDGAFTYATTDLATLKYRVEQLHADAVLYVVGAPQSEHFQLLFETARRWGYDRVECHHVAFGSVLGPDRRIMRTRAGDNVGLESLLDEAVARARRIVDANDDAKPDGPELDEAERAAVAEAVGIGGIKYADLRHNRESDYVFDWDKMLATNGDTATYMQYAFARICGILRKAGIDEQALSNRSEPIRLATPEERALAVQLARFADAVEGSLEDFRPNVLTQYLFETANRFSTFYDACPVLKAPEEATRISRLKICELTRRVIGQGLELLGIRTCPRM